MSHVIRQANPDDIAAIVPWTADTFSWGDYVPDRLPQWLEDDSSAVLVATVDHTPIALLHAVLLSPTEGFLEGARVHPDFRRMGIGNDLNDAGVAWAKAAGARVVRLVTETGNSAAITQVEALGFRQTTEWSTSTLSPGTRGDVSDGNALRLAGIHDADVAWMSWSAGDLHDEARGLITFGWQLRKARPGDLRAAIEDQHLYQSPAGWLIAEPLDSRLRVSWVATSKEEAPRLLAALGRLAAELGVEQISIKTPVVPWMDEALIRAGASLDRLLVFEKPT